MKTSVNKNQLEKWLFQRKTLRQDLINCHSQCLREFDEETKQIEKELQMLKISESSQTKATNLWCRITNALIEKYKFMAEENSDEAVKQLTRLEGALLAGGFLTEQELEKGL